MTRFMEKKLENVFSCDFEHDFRDENCIVYAMSWVLWDELQSCQIIMGLLGGLWLNRRCKNYKLA